MTGAWKINGVFVWNVSNNSYWGALPANGQNQQPSFTVVAACVPNPVVTQSLAVGPSNPVINNQVKATFTITNTGCADFTPKAIGVAARGPGGIYDNQDIGWQTTLPSGQPFVLHPGESFAYTGYKSFGETGPNTFWVDYLDQAGNWHQGQVPVADGVTANLSVNFAPVPACTNWAEERWCPSYYPNTTLAGAPILPPSESGVLAKDWGNGSPSGLPADQFSARFYGLFTFPGGPETFTVHADDGVRFWVDGVMKMDFWNLSADDSHTVSVDLTAGKHWVMVEYFEYTGSAALGVDWSPKYAPPTVTPTFTPTSTATATATNTPTATATDTATATTTETPTATSTPVPTDTPAAPPTDTATAIEVPTDTPTATETPTDTPTATETPTDTPTATETPADGNASAGNGSGAGSASAVRIVGGTASSSHADGPDLAFDGNLTTAWVAGGNGAGESLTIAFDGPVHLVSITVVNGYAASPELFAAYGSVAALRADAGGGAADLTLAQTSEPQTLPLDLTGDHVTLTIVNVYPGAVLTDQIALTEVSFTAEAATAPAAADVASPVLAPTETPTLAPTETPTDTATPTATATVEATATPTAVDAKPALVIQTATATATSVTAKPAAHPTNTPKPTKTPRPTNTATATPRPTKTPRPTATAKPTKTPRPKTKKKKATATATLESDQGSSPAITVSNGASVVEDTPSAGAAETPTNTPSPTETPIPADQTAIDGNASGESSGGIAATDGSTVESDNGAADQPTEPPATTNGLAASPVAEMGTGGGGKLAYAVKNNGHWDIWLHDFLTGAETQLTALPESDQWAPSWSHDGTQLAYLSDETGANQVWIMNPDGSNPRQVTNDGGPDQIMYVSWSADDQSLIVTVGAGDKARLMTVPAAGGDLAPFIDAPASDAAVSADGRIVYTTVGNGNDLAGVNPDGSTGVVVNGPDDEDVASISPNGTLVAYQAGQSPNRRIETTSIDGGAPTQVQTPPGDASDPVWSPDGSQIALVIDDGTNQSLWVVGLNGGQTQLTVAPHEKVWYLSWAPETP